jgi:hypothetical protein
VVSGRSRLFGVGECRLAVFLNRGESGFAMYDWPEKKNPFNPSRYIPIPISPVDNNGYSSNSSTSLGYDCPDSPVFITEDFNKDGSMDILLVARTELIMISST